MSNIRLDNNRNIENSLRNKKKQTRPWFNGKNEKEVVAKLKEAWRMGCGGKQVLNVAKISKYSLSRYLKAHPEIKEIRDILQENPGIVARRTVLAGIEKDARLALRYLELTESNKFNTKQQVEDMRNDEIVKLKNQFKKQLS